MTAQFRVLRIRRPKYGCRACSTIHQAPAPDRLITKGLATAGLISQVLVSKYCDHTPLYRQAQIFARHGARIERSTLAGWVGGACWWLEPLQARLAALRRIAEFYAIEKRIRGQPAEARQRAREAVSWPLVEAMKSWLEDQLHRLPPRGGLAEAIRYALVRWPALCRFLDDGRVELNNNPVERAIRPVALGRKNHLFAGSDGGAERWATVCSLIATAKLNDVETFAYLRDVLERMIEGHSMSRFDDLLPWNWSPRSVNP